MNIAILGTGMVGNALGTKLVRSGRHVMMGSRSSANEKAAQWVKAAGRGASQGTFAEAARFGEIVFDCTAGATSLEALALAGRENLRGKVLIHVANPLDFSRGMPATLTVCNTDSLGEQVQKAFPEAKVVKALNTVNCDVMADPGLVPGDHQIFICGNDAQAKARTVELLGDALGWKKHNIVDLGDISAARATEMVMPIWLRLYARLGHAYFNFRLVEGTKP
jgi:hypothetical protein